MNELLAETHPNNETDPADALLDADMGDIIRGQTSTG